MSSMMDANALRLIGQGEQQARSQLGQAMEKVQQNEQAARLPPLGHPPIDGMNAHLVDRLRQLRAAVEGAGGELYVFSGARDHNKQAQMFAAAVRRYGSEAEAKKHVSLPGQSSHHPDFGMSKGMGEGALGVDVRGDLHLAHRLAPQFGLVFPHANVPWHVEVAGLDKLK